MFGEPVFDKCKQCDCGVKRLIVNKTRYLCEEKNRERLDSNKLPKKKESLREVKNSWGKSKPMKQISSRRVREQTSYAVICEEIKQERPPICESCGNTQRLSFSHLLSRNRRRDLVTEKRNIKVHCLERVDGSKGCHERYEAGDIDDFQDKEEILVIVKELDREFFQLKFGERYDKS